MDTQPTGAEAELREEAAKANARADAALEECDYAEARYERGFAAGIAFALAQRDAR